MTNRLRVPPPCGISFIAWETTTWLVSTLIAAREPVGSNEMTSLQNGHSEATEDAEIPSPSVSTNEWGT